MLKDKTEKLSQIPCNLITGFLGVGKTSVISQLIKQKPKAERWAILVNEFGQVGLDKDFLSNQDRSVFIEQVAGGCMGCTANVPMKITLNRLLKKSMPHRLIIEPSGLGHPEEIVKILTSEYYRQVIQLEAKITILDARYLNNNRYVEHPIYQQQLQLADLLVANKSDLYQTEHDEALTTLQLTYPNKPCLTISAAYLPIDYLSSTSQTITEYKDKQPDPSPRLITALKPITAIRPLAASSSSTRFYSQAWQGDKNIQFEQDAIIAMLTALKAVRVKAAIQVESGFIVLNKSDQDAFNIAAVNSLEQNKIEVIQLSSLPKKSFEKLILACQLT